VVLGEDDLDEDDRAAIEEVKKRGYRCVCAQMRTKQV
jgi:hypothetical protein